MKRLLLVTEGGADHASSRTRGLLYVPTLERRGYAVTWAPRVGPRPVTVGERLRFAVTKRLFTLRQKLLLRRPWEAVYVSRQVLPASALARLAAQRIPLVYDLDDALHLADPDGVGRMLSAAALVIVAAPQLAAAARAHGAHPRVLPTPVDTDAIQPSALPERFTIGWMGSPWTSPYLRLVRGALERIQHETGARVLVVGGRAEDAPPGAEVVPWALADEPARLAEMSVGLMPVPDEPFARGKGAYKLYQYMAAGRPVVASPVGLNAEVVTPEHNGLLASTEAEWYAALRRLYDDAALAARMGAAGRARAEAHFSLRVCAERLGDLLDTLPQPPADADLALHD